MVERGIDNNVDIVVRFGVESVRRSPRVVAPIDDRRSPAAGRRPAGRDPMHHPTETDPAGPRRYPARLESKRIRNGEFVRAKTGLSVWR